MIIFQHWNLLILIFFQFCIYRHVNSANLFNLNNHKKINNGNSLHNLAPNKLDVNLNHRFRSLDILKRSLDNSDDLAYEDDNGEYNADDLNKNELSSELNQVDDDEKSSIDSVQAGSLYVQLNHPFSVKCDDYLIDEHLRNYSFNYILFNQSNADLDECLSIYSNNENDYEIIDIQFKKIKIRTQDLFQKCLRTISLKKPTYNKNLIINSAKYRDSGNYYCVYSNHNEHIITTNNYIIFDSK